MSDIYSVPPVSARAGNKGSAVQWVNASAVFQQVLHKLDAGERKAIVLRCDELPLLQGTEEEIQLLFSGLLQMILQKKDSVSQLFLHINCKTALQETVGKTGRMHYIIQFSTNITPCADWMQANKKQIEEFQTILQQYNGSLRMAESQGCIFSLSLPSKTT
jgi:hypothetical protein